MRYEQLSVGSLILDGGHVTAAPAADSVVLNQASGIVTTKPLTTVANQNYDLTINNVLISPTDMVIANVAKGTDTVGPLTISKVLVGNGSVVIGVKNGDGASPLNGTVLVSFAVIKIQ